jgi:carbamoyltransferase
MIVLGISPLDKDSTVSIVVDGKLVFAAEEERFTRNKLQDGFPTESLQAGL